MTLTVTDRNGKPWSATTPTLTAVQAPVTAIDLSRDGTANCLYRQRGRRVYVRRYGARQRQRRRCRDRACRRHENTNNWVTKGLEQEISATDAVSLARARKGRIFFTAAGAAKAMPSSRLRMPRGDRVDGISGSRRNLGW